MSSKSIAGPRGIVEKVFAIICLAVFWLIPFSPFVAIAAVATTRDSAGWPRALAKTGAILCTLWTVMAAGMLLLFFCLRILHDSWSF